MGVHDYFNFFSIFICIFQKQFSVKWQWDAPSLTPTHRLPKNMLILNIPYVAAASTEIVVSLILAKVAKHTSKLWKFA